MPQRKVMWHEKGVAIRDIFWLYQEAAQEPVLCIHKENPEFFDKEQNGTSHFFPVSHAQGLPAYLLVMKSWDSSSLNLRPSREDFLLIHGMKPVHGHYFKMLKSWLSLSSVNAAFLGQALKPVQCSISNWCTGWSAFSICPQQFCLYYLTNITRIIKEGKLKHENSSLISLLINSCQVSNTYIFSRLLDVHIFYSQW